MSSPDVLTTYILLPSQDLPLLVPLRAIPLLGNPLADLIQPDLRVLVELGYDRTAHQDVPSPFGLFPDVDWAEVAADLQQGACKASTTPCPDWGCRRRGSRRYPDFSKRSTNRARQRMG